MAHILGMGTFYQAFAQSDWMGKAIFLALLALSIGTWTLLVYKFLYTKKALKWGSQFKQILKQQKAHLLLGDLPTKSFRDNPFLSIYLILKKQTVELLNKNRHFLLNKEEHAPYLSPSDIDYVESHMAMEIASQTQLLEKNVYLLSTIVTLAPFLGLLGTVWGILESFKEMQIATETSSNQIILGGLALALTTTVLGLIVAIPALIGYNWLKQWIKEIQGEMECFGHDLLASIELQYRQVDLHKNHAPTL